jgi:hypothetical protein
VPLETLVKDPPVGAVTSMVLVAVSIGGLVTVTIAPEESAEKKRLADVLSKSLWKQTYRSW